MPARDGVPVAGSPRIPVGLKSRDGADVYRGERLAPALMLYPIVGLLLALVIVPIVYVIDTSLYRQNLFQALPPRFVGFDNYSYLFRSSTFEVSLLRSFVFTLTALTAEMALGFLLAAWIFKLRHLPGMAIVRTVMTMPILVAPVVAAVMWRFMYQPDFGIINYALTSVGLPADRMAVEPEHSALFDRHDRCLAVDAVRVPDRACGHVQHPGAVLRGRGARRHQFAGVRPSSSPFRF